MLIVILTMLGVLGLTGLYSWAHHSRGHDPLPKLSPAEEKAYEIGEAG